MQVFKFGGSSMIDAAAIRQVSQIVSQQQEKTVVIVSAMGGVTDKLTLLCEQAKLDNINEDLLLEIEAQHILAIKNLVKNPDTANELSNELHRQLTELADILKSVKTLEEITKKTLDKVVIKGEYLSSRLLNAALVEQGHSSTWVDSAQVIQIVSKQGISFPDIATSIQNAQKTLIPELEKYHIAIMPGFVGKNNHGQTITLGRGGSDLSATIIGRCISAEQVTLYKEIDGLMTADPNIVSEARIVDRIHYREATELAYYGANVLHPRTIIPLASSNIPLMIKNTFHPDRAGTLISNDVGPGEFPVKALTAISKQSMISIDGNGMMGVPGIAARTFTALSSKDISVTLITQASSESSICFTIDDADRKTAITSLNDAFQFELQQKLIDKISYQKSQAIIALVGIGMGGTKGIASKAFSALAKKRINIHAIAQGSSELNISLVVDEDHKNQALLSLHREFRLEKFRSTHSSGHGDISIALFGCGQIGQTFLKQINNQTQYFKEKMDVQCHIAAACDSAAIVSTETPFSRDDIDDIVHFKSKGNSFKKMTKFSTLPNTSEHLDKCIFQHAYMKGIFVDVTASETDQIIKEALLAKMHVVLANKKPLAIPYEKYLELMTLAKENGVQIRYEATVGAGLPILDTLGKLNDAGDTVKSIVGCFSGTLGYIMSSLESGMSFSEAVESAYSHGYTEPDPRDDLNGMDVARKALILARNLGQTLNMEDVQLESLYQPEHDHDDPQTFIANLKNSDEAWQQRIKAASEKKKVLRYVAEITDGKVFVGIQEIDLGSPIGQLKGTDNLINIRTNMYDSNPLVLTGPGAGADVTAAGVLNDVMAIATSQPSLS